MHCIHMHSLKWYLQMVWFYTLRGMKEVDLHIAFLCIHWSDICRYCWRREVLYNLSWLFEEMICHWLFWDYWVLYLQVFPIPIVIPLKCWLIHFFWFKYLVKTIHLLRCFHITLALLNVGTWFMLRMREVAARPPSLS
jgi:hypothetical protein